METIDIISELTHFHSHLHLNYCISVRSIEFSFASFPFKLLYFRAYYWISVRITSLPLKLLHFDSNYCTVLLFNFYSHDFHSSCCISTRINVFIQNTVFSVFIISIWITVFPFELLDFHSDYFDRMSFHSHSCISILPVNIFHCNFRSNYCIPIPITV